MRARYIFLSVICLLMLTLAACGSDSERENINTHFLTMADGREAVVITNESEDVDLSEGLFQFYAIYRDDEGKVTGVSDVNVEGFDADEYPVFPAGEEVSKTAEVYDDYPGDCQIVLTWLGVMTQ